MSRHCHETPPVAAMLPSIWFVPTLDSVACTVVRALLSSIHVWLERRIVAKSGSRSSQLCCMQIDLTTNSGDFDRRVLLPIRAP